MKLTLPFPFSSRIGLSMDFSFLCPGIWGAIAAAAVSAAGSIYSSNQAKKAAQASMPKPLDLNKLIEDARSQYAKNYSDQLALERQFNPGQAALRDLSNAGLTNLSTGNTTALRARDSLLASGRSDLLDTGAANPLLAESSDSILNSLRLGGNLSAETQNAVTRGALQKGGFAGISGSQAGRGLVARDLGLTSLALEQQRQQAGLTAGQALSQDAASRSKQAFDRFSALSGFTGQAAGQDIETQLRLAAEMSGRPYPVAGLNPASTFAAATGDKYYQDDANAELQKQLAKARSDKLNTILGFGKTVLGGGSFTNFLGTVTGQGGAAGNAAGNAAAGTGGAGYI